MSSPVTIQPATRDTLLDESAKTTNYGGGAFLEVCGYGGGYNERVLVTFDFAASVPAGAVINVATLSLYLFGYGDAANMPVSVSRMLRTTWVSAQATWNIFKTGSSWGTVGCLNSSTDYTATDAASATLPNPSAAGWITWDVKKLAQTARDSVSGVLHLVLGTSQAGYADFRSSEYGTASYRPKLYIEYSYIKTINGLAKASNGVITGVAVASAKAWNGVA